MLVEQFVKNPEALSRLRDALSSLYEIGFFGVLLDLGSQHNVSSVATATVERQALCGAFRDGYGMAVQDLFYFLDRYTGEKSTKPTPDFGSRAYLLASGEITLEEYNKLGEKE